MIIDREREKELTAKKEKKGWPWWVFFFAGIALWGMLSLCSAFAPA